MNDDIRIRRVGRAGRITLNRPAALNALTYDMCLAIEKSLDAWAHDASVDLVIIDAEGDKAFCSGGDILRMYETAKAADYDYGRQFWADEYRLNAKIHNYAKPYVAFMQGFTMGGGVGISCHGSHRVVCETSQIAMPECGIGLVPDVGGTYILSRAPGHLGEYLGTTGTRMGPADAIYAGFADTYVAREAWPQLTAELERTGNCTLIQAAATPPETGKLTARQLEIDTHFAGQTVGEILASLENAPSEFAAHSLAALHRQSPLSAACAIEMVHRARQVQNIEAALEIEYRFVSRAAEHGDFVEGIRAAIIDKDRTPNWRHAGPGDVGADDIDAMLLPLGPNALNLRG